VLSTPVQHPNNPKNICSRGGGGGVGGGRYLHISDQTIQKASCKLGGQGPLELHFGGGKWVVRAPKPPVPPPEILCLVTGSKRQCSQAFGRDCLCCEPLKHVMDHNTALIWATDLSIRLACDAPHFVAKAFGRRNDHWATERQLTTSQSSESCVGWPMEPQRASKTIDA
jgi:hypothetical protein